MATEPAPQHARAEGKRVVIAGMYSPALAWLQNATVLLLQQQSPAPIWVGWDHELADADIPAGAHVVVRAYQFDYVMADKADVVVYSHRDLRDAVVALDDALHVGATLDTAVSIFNAATPWANWAVVKLPFEAIVASPANALARLAGWLRIEAVDLQTTVAMLGDSLLSPGCTPSASFKDRLPEAIIAEIEGKFATWLTRNGYPLISFDASICHIAEQLNDSSAMEGELASTELRQRYHEIRGAVRYLRRRLREFGSVPNQLEAAAKIAALASNRRAALVGWAELLEESGQVKLAAEKAYDALSIVYDDVYTQTLYLRCAGKPNPFQNGEKHFCRRPFTGFEIYEDGSVCVCNATCMPFSIGNAFLQDADAIWKSDAAVALRRSVLDGSFRYCSPMTCPRRGSLLKREEHREEFASLVSEGIPGRLLPKRINLSYDRSCNVSCPSCRAHMIMATREQRNRLDSVRDRVVMPLLKTAIGVYITGSGDAFASLHFRGILKQLCAPEYAHVEIALGTNGQLITPRLWEEFSPLHARFEEIMISVDGATPETYERLRRGSSWKRLLEVMSLLGDARRAGRVRRVVVQIVVQRENFREMRELARLCEDWSVDRLRLFRLRQWGHIPAEKYQEADIVHPGHPQHGELLDELSDPVFATARIEPFELQDVVAVARQRRSSGNAEPASALMSPRPEQGDPQCAARSP